MEHITIRRSLCVFLGCFLLMVSGCTPNKDKQDGLTLKDAQELLSTTIDANGQTLEFAIDDQMATITITPDANRPATSITISSTPIQSSQFDIPINPVTPLISISLSAPLKSPLVMKLPIAKKANSVTAAVSYKLDTRLLETMESFLTEDEILEVLINATTDFFVTSVAEDLVLATIDTGFRPSIDGYQISNIINYWENLGMCSGMARSALYYFHHLKPTQGQLYNKFTETTGFEGFTTPTFVMDDVNVIKLNALMQASTYGTTYGEYYWKVAGDPKAKHFYRMVYHMLISNRPQIVHLYEKPYDPQTKQPGGYGHAVIVYRISANHAYIYDPNWPNDETRKLEIDTINNTFIPYNGAINAQAPALLFQTMIYFPKEHILDTAATRLIFDKLLNDEKLLDDPAFQISQVEIQFDNEVRLLPLAKNTITHKNTMTIELTAPAKSYVKVYDKNLNYIALSDLTTHRFDIALSKDDNILGFEVFVPSKNDPNKIVFGGFEWINIQSKDFDPWSIVSTITDINTAIYTPQEIQQLMGRVIESNILMFYFQQDSYYQMYNPANGENFTMMRIGNNVSYELRRPTDNNDTLINTFNGTVVSDSSITGTTIISLQNRGHLYTMSVVMSKDD